MNQDMFDPIDADPVDVLDRGMAAMVDARKRWPERLQELFDVEMAINKRRGMVEAIGIRDAGERVFAIASYLGGRQIYLPNAEKLRVAVRDAQISRLSEAIPVAEIARRFHLTETQVYCIAKAEKERLIAKLQGRLFE